MTDAVIARLQKSATSAMSTATLIGAVVGAQPFGRPWDWSGTGPKVAGPHYLARFAVEQTVTVNTAAAGGRCCCWATSRP